MSPETNVLCIKYLLTGQERW